MKSSNSSAMSKTRHRTNVVIKKFDKLIMHLRHKADHLEALKAQALFETAAEVLLGLKTAFQHYQDREEPPVREEEKYIGGITFSDDS
jgi:hypothetical protein